MSVCISTSSRFCRWAHVEKPADNSTGKKDLMLNAISLKD